MEKKYSKIFPKIHSKIKGKEFRLTRSQVYLDYLKKNPDSLKNVKLDRGQTNSILNFINGKRSITTIYKNVNAETGKETSMENIKNYLDILKSMNWIDF